MREVLCFTDLKSYTFVSLKPWQCTPDGLRLTIKYGVGKNLLLIGCLDRLTNILESASDASRFTTLTFYTPIIALACSISNFPIRPMYISVSA